VGKTAMNPRKMLFTSNLKPTSGRNVLRELRGLDRTNKKLGLDFEEYIAELFTNLGWKVFLTPITKDYGVDLFIQSSSGLLIAIQAKDYSDALKVKAVQEVASGILFYRKEPQFHNKPITHQVVIASGMGYTEKIDDLFSPYAKELAKRADVLLWGPKELKILADAPLQGMDTLRFIGLEEPQRQSTITAQPMTQVVPVLQSPAYPDPPKKPFNWLAAVFLVVFLVMVVLVSFPKSRTLVGMTYIPSDIEAAEGVKSLLLEWDKEFVRVTRDNDTSKLALYTAKSEYSALFSSLEGRKSSGCSLQITELAPSVVFDVISSYMSANATMENTWSVLEVCGNGSTRQLPRDNTNAKRTRYTLEFIDNRWKIISSKTIQP
jgi:hypothetical protein